MRNRIDQRADGFVFTDGSEVFALQIDVLVVFDIVIDPFGCGRIEGIVVGFLIGLVGIGEEWSGVFGVSAIRIGLLVVIGFP